MVEENWKDTLYIWDGIVTMGTPEVGKEHDSPVPLQWEGSWVPVMGVPDAADAEAPKRNAFKKDIEADCKFLVTGTAAQLGANGEQEGDDEIKDDTENDDDDRFFVAKLTKGEGWEMRDGTKKSRHPDTVHDVWIKSLKWTGNQRDQRESLVVAKGKNEFGPFVSVGWIRPGCRWTVARRYLSDDDPRASWPFRKLYQTVVDETISIIDGSGEKQLRDPPWQTTVMHVNYQEPAKGNSDEEVGGGGKRRKTTHSSSIK
jgi:hypothetical protein